MGGDETELKTVSTSLEKLGISTTRKEPIDTLCWGERYKIKLFITEGERRLELSPDMTLKCHNCHQTPPKGALMLGVPYRYVPSYIHRHDYAPEWVNMVKGIRVERLVHKEAETKGPKTKTDQKSMPKTTYLKRDLPSHEVVVRKQTLAVKAKKAATLVGQVVEALAPELAEPELVEADYFDTLKPVCSIPCMITKGRELAERDPRFRNVEMLIAMLYQRIFDRPMPKIRPAPNFEVLQDHGGSYTVEEYRREFQFVTIEEHGSGLSESTAPAQPVSWIVCPGSRLNQA